MFGARGRMARRQEFVARYELPQGLGNALVEQYPEISSIEVGIRGLWQWLRLHVASSALLAMPSKAVDLLWHEFILNTAEYARFCRGAYGRALHHAPERAMDEKSTLQLQGEGMGRTFAMACRDEGIQYPRALALPLLFRVDSELALPDGQQWILNCGHVSCTAKPPIRCIHHQVLGHIPRDLPLQRQPNTGKWFTTGTTGLVNEYGSGSSGAGCGGHGCGGHGGGH